MSDYLAQLFVVARAANKLLSLNRTKGVTEEEYEAAEIALDDALAGRSLPAGLGETTMSTKSYDLIDGDLEALRSVRDCALRQLISRSDAHDAFGLALSDAIDKINGIIARATGRSIIPEKPE